MAVCRVRAPVVTSRLRAMWLVLALALTGAGASDLPPLVAAAKEGDGDRLRALLDHGADVNAADPAGTTALHWASYRDDLASVELLIGAGADVNAVTDLGATALWNASSNGSTAVVRSLIAAGARANTKLLLGETALMAAARVGNPEVVRQLAAAGADVNAAAARGQTALMWAVANQHPAVVDVLLEYGADVRARSHTWSQVMGVPPHSVTANQRSIAQGGSTPLMFAARVGDLASARLLLATGADVNDTDASGISATTLAAFSGFTELVELLLDQGADPNADAAGFTALHGAIMRSDEAMVAALLTHGADPNAPLRTWTPTRRGSQDYYFNPAWIGASPLWLAARFSPPGIMRRLLREGADPLFVHHGTYYRGEDDLDSVPQRETTTILMAVLGMGGGGRGWVLPDPVEREAHVFEAARLAVDLGVDVNAANTNGRTAVQAAAALGYTSVVDFLVANGATR